MQDKRTVILDTTLKLLVERGFYDTPMSEIARQSGVSVGIIYHYFESKDDLIRQLYREIKARFGQALLAGSPQQLRGIETLKRIWFNAYHYYVEHPQQTLFLEQYENSPYFVAHLEEGADSEIEPLMAKFQQDVEAGVYANLPLIVFYELTLGVAMALAKRQIVGMVNLDDATLEKLASAVCRSVQPL